jgi:polyhydroxybutyrate depolymerase
VIKGMRISFLRSGAVVVCFAAILCLVPAALADQMTWTVDGVAREAIIVPPAKPDASGKGPIIFVFHGHGDTMENMANAVRMERYWPEAVIVYPQGLPTNAAADPEGWGWVYNADKDGQRDVKFVDAMLATLGQKYPLDDQRVYATGFSNGAVFSYQLWSARPKVFAAFVVVAGRVNAMAPLKAPKPVMIVAGQRDRTVNFKDQLAAIETAREVDGATAEGSACGEGCTLYPSTKKAPVITYIHGGDHVYPAGTPYLSVQFFKQHPFGR